MSMTPRLTPKAPSAPKAPVVRKPSVPKAASLRIEAKRPIPARAAAPKVAAPRAEPPKVKVGKAGAPPAYRPTFAALKPKMATMGGPAFGKSNRLQMAQAMSSLVGNYAALGMKGGAAIRIQYARPKVKIAAPKPVAPTPQPQPVPPEVFKPYAPRPKATAIKNPTKLAALRAARDAMNGPNRVTRPMQIG